MGLNIINVENNLSCLFFRNSQKNSIYLKNNNIFVVHLIYHKLLNGSVLQFPQKYKAATVFNIDNNKKYFLFIKSA